MLLALHTFNLFLHTSFKGEGAIIERADFNGRGNSFMKQFKFPPKCGISGHMTSPKVC